LGLLDSQKVGNLLAPIINDSQIGAVRVAVGEKIKRKADCRWRLFRPRKARDGAGIAPGSPRIGKIGCQHCGPEPKAEESAHKRAADRHDARSREAFL
jgi:hypothetical protein